MIAGLTQREYDALLACVQGDLTTIAHWPYSEALQIMHELERRALVIGVRHAERVQTTQRAALTDNWTEWYATEAGIEAAKKMRPMCKT